MSIEILGNPFVNFVNFVNFRIFFKKRKKENLCKLKKKHTKTQKNVQKTLLTVT